MTAEAPVAIRPRLAGARHGLSATARSLAALFVVVATTAVGIGWLYLLRHAGALGAGPRIGEALPLQRLAGNASQPLLRLVAAWLPTGVVAGFALRGARVRHRDVRAGVMFVGCLVVLLIAGAVADGLTANESVRSHLAAQPHRAATWLAAALMALGAAA